MKKIYEANCNGPKACDAFVYYIDEERNLVERGVMLKEAAFKRHRPKGSTGCGFRAAIRAVKQGY